MSVNNHLFERNEGFFGQDDVAVDLYKDLIRIIQVYCVGVSAQNFFDTLKIFKIEGMVAYDLCRVFKPQEGEEAYERPELIRFYMTVILAGRGFDYSRKDLKQFIEDSESYVHIPFDGLCTLVVELYPGFKVAKAPKKAAPPRVTQTDKMVIDPVKIISRLHKGCPATLDVLSRIHEVSKKAETRGDGFFQALDSVGAFLCGETIAIVHKNICLGDDDNFVILVTMLTHHLSVPEKNRMRVDDDRHIYLLVSEVKKALEDKREVKLVGEDDSVHYTYAIPHGDDSISIVDIAQAYSFLDIYQEDSAEG